MTAHDIKHPTLTDLPGMARVLEETGLFPPDLLPDMLLPALEGGAETGLWLISGRGEEITGFAYAAPEAMAEGVWSLLALAVRPGWQGQGAGHSLTRALMADPRMREGRLLLVDTSGAPDYAPARAFYLACGFTQVARIPDFWADGDDKVTFLRRLT